MRLPRNAKAIIKARAKGRLQDGDCFIVSFVGTTCLEEPHVYVDSDRRYDWDFVSGLHASIVVRPGVKAGQVMEDLYRLTVLYPNLIDFEQQIVGSLVEKADGSGLKLWPRRQASESWRALFA